MTLIIELDDVEIEGTRNVVITEGLDRVATASFEMPYQAITGSADIKIKVSGTKRFWGNIDSYHETNDGMLAINAISKANELKHRLVPYTEIPYTAKDGGWIAKQMLAAFADDWCDSSGISEELGTIAYIRFVGQTRAEALNDIADLLGLYWFWNPIDSVLHLTELGYLASSTMIPARHIVEDEWETDFAEIYNLIYIKGGPIDGDPANGYVTKFAWDAVSEYNYGSREYKPYVDNELINETVAQKLADALLAKYKDPLVMGVARGIPYDPNLKIGEMIVISDTSHDGTYLVQRLTIDFETWTMEATLSNLPLLFEQTIRNIQADLDRLKKAAIPLYEEGKPILIRMELMRRDSTVAVTESFEDALTLPFELPATLGGMMLDRDTVHRI